MPELSPPIIDTIVNEIGIVAQNYYRLLILVARLPANTSESMSKVATRLGHQVTNLNAELSAVLLGIPHRQWQLKAHKVVGDIVDDESGDLILFDHTDILFSPTLQLDAIGLLKNLSRNKTVVATWQGEIKGGKIQHAEEWHPEHQIHSIDDIKVIAVDTIEYRDGWTHSQGAFDA